MFEIPQVRDSLLLLVDMQTRLQAVMSNNENCLNRAALMLKAARELQLDTIVTEQYPQGLGHTEPELQKLLATTCPVIEKSSFSCCGEPAFMTELIRKKYRSIAVIGIETHVCIQQTVLELLNKGYQVLVLQDAVTSRFPDEKECALALLRQAGAVITTVESYLFMLMRDAKHSAFKNIARLIR